VTRSESVRPEWRAALAQAGVHNLAVRLLEEPVARGLPGRWEALDKPGIGGRRRWRWSVPLAAGAQTLYVKRYDAAALPEQWDRILRQSARHSRAWWEFTQSRRLAEANVPAAAAVAFVEEMNGRLERRSAVVLESVPGDALDRVWPEALAQHAPLTLGAARHDLARRLGRFVSAFHGTGLCHRDLYLCHVFVDVPLDYSSPPRFALIDLARTHQPRWRRTRWILKDLSQLDVSARQIGASRSDRLRFLLAYLGLQRKAARTRWYARRIVHRSDRVLRRIARKSRGG
jgi:heptose I phosphotransferase